MGPPRGPSHLEVVLPRPTATGSYSSAGSRPSRGPGAEAWEAAQSLGDSETRSLRPSLGETPHPGFTAAVSFRKGLPGELSSPKTSLQFSGEGRPWGRGKLGSSLRESTSPIFCLLALLKESAERVPAAVSRQLPGCPGCASPRWWEEPSLVTPWKLSDEEAQRGMGGEGRGVQLLPRKRGWTPRCYCLFKLPFWWPVGQLSLPRREGLGQSKVISGRIDIILKVLTTLIKTSSRPDSAMSPIPCTSHWTPVWTSVHAQIPPNSPVL